MAHTLSSKKRIRQNAMHRALNRWRKRRIHDAIRKFESQLHADTIPQAEEAYRNVASILDKVAGKGTIHRNRAARKKSRLNKRLHAFKVAHSG